MLYTMDKLLLLHQRMDYYYNELKKCARSVTLNLNTGIGAWEVIFMLIKNISS